MPKFPLILLPVILTLSCGKHTVEALKKASPQKRLTASIQFIEQKEYWKAQELLATLVNTSPDNPIRESALYYYAITFYHLKEYHQALQYLYELITTYPHTPFMENARYYIIKSYYNLTLPYNLDQTTTYRTIELIRLFLKEYPDSKYYDECVKMLNELELRLQKKAFYNAYTYFKIQKYKSAMISFHHVLEDYPFHYNRSKVVYYLILSAYLYAINSVPDKQLERLSHALELFKKYHYLAKGTPEETRLLRLSKQISEKLQHINHDRKTSP